MAALFFGKEERFLSSLIPTTWWRMVSNTRKLGMEAAEALAPLNQPPSLRETFSIPRWMETSFTSSQGYVFFPMVIPVLLIATGPEIIC